LEVTTREVAVDGRLAGRGAEVRGGGGRVAGDEAPVPARQQPGGGAPPPRARQRADDLRPPRERRAQRRLDHDVAAADHHRGRGGRDRRTPRRHLPRLRRRGGPGRIRGRLMPDQAARPVAIVTGSATGIGAACARRLAEEGFNVVINYTTSEAEAQQTAAECQRTGVETLVVRANVADNGDCRRLAAAAVDAWGRLDVLVNNAGITRFARPDNLEKLTPADFADIFAVNVTGAWLMTRAAHPHLKASPVAAIVNV